MRTHFWFTLACLMPTLPLAEAALIHPVEQTRGNLIQWYADDGQYADVGEFAANFGPFEIDSTGYVGTAQGYATGWATHASTISDATITGHGATRTSWLGQVAGLTVSGLNVSFDVTEPVRANVTGFHTLDDPQEFGWHRLVGPGGTIVDRHASIGVHAFEYTVALLPGRYTLISSAGVIAGLEPSVDLRTSWSVRFTAVAVPEPGACALLTTFALLLSRSKRMPA